MPANELLEVKEFLNTPKKVFITSHRNPDGDALGSSLAFYHYLRINGHTVSIGFPSEFPSVYKWMIGSEFILIYDNDPEIINERIKEAELIFFLDANNLSRIDKLGEEIEKYDVPIVHIDHHMNPDTSFTYSYVDPKASSTCDLVFDVLTGWEGTSFIDNEVISTCLYTGILTDTGTFSHNTNPVLFEKISRLLQAPFDHISIQSLVNNSLPEKNLRLLGYCLYKRLEVIPEYKTGIIFLTKSDFAKFDIQRGDTEGIVNYILKIKDIDIAVFFTQQPTIIKISFRSLGDFNVEEIARQYFNGGGHKNASGGSHFKGLKSAMELFKEKLPEFFKKHKTNN